MINRPSAQLLCLFSLLLFACQTGPNPIVATLTIQSTQPATVTPLSTEAPVDVTEEIESEPTLTPIQTATPSPEPTEAPTATPRPSATVIPTPLVVASPTREIAFEWLPRSYVDRDPGLLSLSGGTFAEFTVVEPYVYVRAGHSLVVYDLSVEPIGPELMRLPLRGPDPEFVLDGRFLYLDQGDTVEVYGVDGPEPLYPVARIDGLGVGELVQGNDDAVYFAGKDGLMWQLDVDPALPAKPVGSLPRKLTGPNSERERLFSEVWSFYDAQSEERADEKIWEQAQAIYPDVVWWFPGELQLIEDQLYATAPTNGDGGGGIVMRIDMSEMGRPIIRSAAITFQPTFIEVDQGRLFTGFVADTASDLSLIDLSDPARPTYLRRFDYHSRAVYLEQNTLFSGHYPTLVSVDISDLDRPQLLGEVNIEKQYGTYLYHLEKDPDRPILYTIPGLHEPAGLAIFSIESVGRPELLALLRDDAKGVHMLRYHNQTLYGVSQLDQTFAVFDVSDPTAPELIFEMPTEARPGGVEVWTDAAGQTIVALLTVEGLTLMAETTSNTFEPLAEIATPAGCEFVRNKWGYFPGYEKELRYQNGMLFAPLGLCDIHQIDVTDPQNPTIVRTFWGSGSLEIEDELLIIGGRNLSIYQIAE